ncbi:MAG: hypothetical protein Unbinned7358contig1001_18 [Prokaryotic dsDNA virus sp.]|nr:MAG: hypothetical protein Unbinned7358contig1001_18 [Prokaryotic dsDNA virus sp.]|tara:strand:- start:143 stop:358 length:216 start_codon:yes stop_codon:yes gene_type:complete
MTPQDLKKLTGEDVAAILRLWKDDIIIFAGVKNQHCITPEIDSISMNGGCPQINTGDINEWNQYGQVGGDA